MKKIIFAFLGTLSATLIATSAQSASVIIHESLSSNDAKFYRPESRFLLNFSGSQPHFDAHQFTVDDAGDYTFNQSSLHYDTFLLLYSGNFDPSSPLSNLSILNDDHSGSIRTSQFTYHLETDTQYFAVAASYGSYKTGTYRLEITGPGNILLNTDSPAGAVPEPATWAMLIMGFGLVGGALRRRQATSARTA